MNINSKEISNKIDNKHSMNNYIKEEDKSSSNLSNSFPLMNYEYITKGRKTVYNSSKINLQSPKKENPSRSKRMTLLGKKDIDIQMNKKNSELFSFGKQFLDSSKKRNINESNIDDNNNQNLNYKKLIKKISIQLKKRVKLPTCKIIKIYQPYRGLIFRIANDIKKNFNQKKFEEKYKNKEREKFGPSLTRKDESIDSKKREIISQANNINANDENINLLLNIDDSIQNQNYINQFETFLNKNTIELSNDKLSITLNGQSNLQRNVGTYTEEGIKSVTYGNMDITTNANLTIRYIVAINNETHEYSDLKELETYINTLPAGKYSINYVVNYLGISSTKTRGITIR